MPEEQIRYHICWGSWQRAARRRRRWRRTSSTSSCRSTPARTSIEQANPRHEHEWRIWEDVKLPDGKVLIPGVITHQTNVVEHPELVAERLVAAGRARRARERHGGTDCGFAQGRSCSACTRVDPVGEAAVAGRGRRDRDARAVGRRGRLTFAFVQDVVVGRA